MEIRPIRTEADYEAALVEIERLFDAAPNTPEGDRLDVLTTLVEAYEMHHYPIPEPDPVEAIKADVQTRLGQRGRRRAPLSGTRTSSAVPVVRPMASAPAPVAARAEPAPKPFQVANQGGVTVHRGSAPASTGQQTPLAPAPKTTVGAAAVVRVKASEAYRTAQQHVGETARSAGAADPAAGLKSLASPTIRAASFPASVPEDK